MRILQICPLPGPGSGGKTYNAWALIGHLNDSGHQVWVLSWDGFARVGKLATAAWFGEALLKSLSRNGSCAGWERRDEGLWATSWRELSGKAAPLRLPVDGTVVRYILDRFGLKTFLLCYRAALSLSSIIHDVRPDVVHLHYNAVLFPLALKLLHPNVPLLTWIHSWDQFVQYRGLTDYLDRIDRKALECAQATLDASDQLVFVCKHLADSTEDYGLMLDRPYTVVRPEAPEEEIQLLDKTACKQELSLHGRRIILFCGLLRQRKNPDMLVKAIASNQELRENYTLVVIGDGELRERVEELVARRGIDCHFTGRLPRSEMSPYYNAADVFVMPSISEGWASVYVEALLAGTPVIGHHKNIREIEDVLGIDVGEPYDPSTEPVESLAQKILRVSERTYDRQMLRRMVLKHVGPEVTRSMWDHIYDDLAMNSKQQGRPEATVIRGLLGI